MRIKAIVFIIACLVVPYSLVADDPVLPLAFEVNEGQWREGIQFVGRGRNGIVALDSRGAILISDSASEELRMEFAGARSELRVEGADPLPQTTSYFLGGDPSTWRSNVRSFQRVVYRGIYPGIDAVFHSGRTGELEYDFIVTPRSDPRTIVLRFKNASSVTLDRGELVIGTGSAAIRMAHPVAWQEIAGSRVSVDVTYRMRGSRSVGFAVGSYDETRELIIDPVVLGFSTFLGGAGDEAASSMTVDHDRYVYVAGTTRSTGFPIKGGVRGTLAGGDIFVAKLTPGLDQIVFSTFLGGSGDEGGRPTIAVDSRGDIYLGGSTPSPDFPTTEGAPQRTYGGGPTDAFVLKLSADGSRLLFSTLLGGEEGDPANGLSIDRMRNIYIAGSTSSTRFPATAGAFQTMLRGSRNAYVAKLRADPPSLQYATYIGGSAETLGIRIASDASGAAYLIGRTLATDFPTTPAAFQSTFGGTGLGFGDGFVTKIAPDGSTLMYSTYLGGLSGETLEGIAVDSTGAAVVTGLTYSQNFPTTPGTAQPTHGGGDADNFVVKLSPEGDRLLFGTFLGGNNSEQANGIALDPLGNVHVAGTTSSPDFPTTPDALSRVRKGQNDGFVTILSSDASEIVYSTYVGGNAPSGGPQDNLWAVAVDSAGNTYVAGQTRSLDFPTTTGALQTTHKGGDDVYVTKFVTQRPSGSGELRVIPVVGSTAGALGSYFRTSFQLHNPRTTTIGGRFLFHPQGREGREDDPWFDYFLAPGETMAVSDLLPSMSQSGLGSVDLLAADDQLPETVIRIFNDAGVLGTTGMSEDPIPVSRALQSGTTGFLIAPPSTETARFNIGLRTLAEGARIAITVRRSDGTVAHSLAREYPGHFFEQRSAFDFLGFELDANDSIALHIETGSAVIYGSTTDNITQDPSLQLARGPDSVSGEARVIPVVGSTPGAFGSFFKTGVQLFNPGETGISGRLVYHPRGASGHDADPSLEYHVGPGETLAFGDLLPAMGLSGLGSADIVSTSGPLPLSVIRIFNDAGPAGTTGMTQRQVTLEEVLQTGDEGVLIAPRDPEKARLNIGIRTLSQGATITARLLTPTGQMVRSVTRNYPSTWFTQVPAADLLEAQLSGNDTIRLQVDEGAAIIYGSTTDNITQDPTLQIVRRLE